MITVPRVYPHIGSSIFFKTMHVNSNNLGGEVEHYQKDATKFWSRSGSFSVKRKKTKKKLDCNNNPLNVAVHTFSVTILPFMWKMLDLGSKVCVFTTFLT